MEINRSRPEVEVGRNHEAVRAESIYDRYPGLTRDDADVEQDRGRSR